MTSRSIASILEASGRPDLAAHHWERIQPHLNPAQDGPGLSCLLSLAGNSAVLIDYLLKTADPSREIAELLGSTYLDRPKPRTVMLREIESLYGRAFDGTLASAQKLLREYKYREFLRIAGRDLSGLAPFEETGLELSSLASASAEIAVRAATHLLKDAWDGGSAIPPFTVMGLGKLGGEDLNFSSDMDVIYVHGSPPAASARSAFEYFCRLSETVTRLLHERTNDGIVFRVDLDLRPEGKSGVIVNSLEALASYYEASGAPWERGALIKAVPVAGDDALGRKVLNEVEPFVFPKHVGGDDIRHLKEMKAKINAELHRNSPNAGYHLKLGRGGIREIEFFVMAFQLIYGGRQPKLRERNTLKALARLEETGLVPAEHAGHLREAYIFLRRAENRLQMEDERQVHALPKDADGLEALARRCGYAGAGPFVRELETHTERVAAYFENLAS